MVCEGKEEEVEEEKEEDESVFFSRTRKYTF
jgi:hypothetical protein